MNTTQTATAAGTYYPATPGARTVADAKPLYIGGKQVSAVVDTDGGYSVFVGSVVVAYGQLDGTEKGLAGLFAEIALEATTPALEIVADLAADQDAVTEALGYSEAVTSVRAAGAEIAAQADAVDVTTPVRYRGREVPTDFPTHPVQRAACLRREADILMAWTNEDETNYKRYISEGLADTDGYYAPVKRSAWKSFS